MSNVAVAFYKRGDLYTGLELPAGVTATVLPYSSKAVGGSDMAMLRIDGQQSQLYEMLNWTRVGVTITNHIGDPCWWGYISKITLYDHGLTITVDIERMTNRVAVAYTLVSSGESTTGPRRTTDWADDDESIAEFGTRELLDSLGGVNATHAETKRDRQLELYKYPLALPQIEPDANMNDLSMEIECRGWWETLSWRYAVVPALLAFAYQTLGTTEQNIGQDNDDDADNKIALAQMFRTGAAGWNLQEVELYFKKTGSPPNDITVSIHEVDTGDDADDESDDTPGSSLGSVTVSALDVSTSYGWITFTLSSPISLSADTPYFLQVEAGGVHSTGYYIFKLDQNEGYSDGFLLRQTWNESTWDTLSSDMPFRIYTNALVENTQQIKSLITDYGQFLNRVRIEDAASVTSESFRNGDSDVQFEIEELLDAGTSAGKRLLAEVLPSREVVIKAEDDQTLTTPYSVDRDGTFWYYDTKMEPSTCPSGFWCRLRDVLPDTLNTSQLSGLGAFFIESNEYNPETNTLRYTALGLDDVFDTGAEVG